jgi:putative redox protein
MSQTVTTTWKENMLLESDNPNGNHVLMETDPNFGGTNMGLNPKALMLSSLGGCTGLDILSLFKKMRVEVDDIKIIVNGELTKEHPKYYNKVRIDFHFTGTELNQAKITKAVNLSEERYCGVLEMFRQFAEVKTYIHFHKN